MTNPMTVDAIGERLIELETRLAFQDNTSNELNDAVTAQARRIAQLERALAMLQRQMQAMAPPLTAPASEETPPPHY